MIHGVLFDLDGTLLDTAPDMVGALNELRIQCDLLPLPFADVRDQVSLGAAALIHLGFKDESQRNFDALLQRFLALYRSRVARETRAFPQMLDVLDALEDRGIHWGIVTNKPEWLTTPLLHSLDLFARARIVVSGDTLPERKPHPRPLLHAAERMQVDARHCIYVGDAERDIQAARAARMVALVACFGYVPAAESFNHWPGHGWVDSPLQILDWLALSEPELSAHIANK